MSDLKDPLANLSRLSVLLLLLVVMAFTGWRFQGGDRLSDAIEDYLLDLRFQLRGELEPPQDFVLLAIDPATTDQLGWSPPPRRAIAEAIEIVMASGPRVLAIDLLFLDPGADDDRLAEALGHGRPVVLAIAALLDEPATNAMSPALAAALDRSAFSVVVGEPAISAAPVRLLAPRDAFLENSRLALATLSEGRDRVARHAPLAAPVGGLFLPALGLEAARQYAGVGAEKIVLFPGSEVRFGDSTLETDRNARVIINHYGGAGQFRSYGLIDVLEGRVSSSVFEDSAVFLGVTDESFLDVFATPFATEVPGVEIMATVAANIAYDDVPRTAGPARAISLIAPVSIALVIAASGSVLPTAVATVTCALIWVIGIALIQLPFSMGNMVVDATSVLFSLLTATALAIVLLVRREQWQRRAIGHERSNLVRYVSPLLADELSRNATPGFDQRAQMAAVLFADVKGYTSLAENLSTTDTAGLVKNIHRFFERCAEAHQGVVISFEGDGAMICFGLPEPKEDDASRALQCGRALVQGIGSVDVPKHPEQRLTIRVGGHFGPVTAALVGGTRHAHVTLSGDTVNVASRLQGVAKTGGANFVVSRSLLDAGSHGAGPPASEPPVRMTVSELRGRKGEIETWSI